MSINTKQVTLTVIDADEITRIEKQQTDSAISVATLTSQVQDLTAKLAALTPTPPPPPPVVTRGELVIEGGKLRQVGMATGDSVVLRVMEISYGESDHTFGPDKICALVKSLGFNGISPLFDNSFSSLLYMKALGDAALRAGLVFLPNGDHVRGGRAWLTNPENVAYLNSLPNCIVRLEIEVDIAVSNTDPTNADYYNGCMGLVAAYRAAGGTRIIQVGAYQGGRRLEHVIASGVQVATSDRRTLLGWQAYWSKTGTWYQGCAGVSSGVKGTLEGIGRLATLPAASCLGLVWRNAEQALCDALLLIDECIRLKQSFMWWEMAKDGITDNNIMDSWKLDTITANGKAIRDKLLPSQRLYY
jgi:hypothetical protein